MLTASGFAVHPLWGRAAVVALLLQLAPLVEVASAQLLELAAVLWFASLHLARSITCWPWGSV
jgi:hypothetical protein